MSVKRGRNVQKVAFLASVFAAAAVVEITLDAGTLIATAEARIGRPLTPVSVAGVARRTTRRAIRRTAVFVAVLPAGCHTVIIEGITLQQCGGTYYQASGNQYVVVEVN